MGEVVTVLRARLVADPYSGEDEHPDWSNPVRVDLHGCMVAPRASVEPEEVGRGRVIVGLTVYAPPGADITATDRLIVRGLTYEVDGEPGVWVNGLSGRAAGVEVAVTRVTG